MKKGLVTEQLVELRTHCSQNPVAFLLWKSLLSQAAGISSNERQLFGVTRSGTRITTAVLQASNGHRDFESQIADPVIAPFVGPYDERLGRFPLMELPANILRALRDLTPGAPVSLDVLRQKLASCAA